MTSELSTSAANTATTAGGSRKLIASLGMTNFGVFLIWGAVPSVLLALQLQDFDAANKEANFALVAMVGSVVSTIAQPFWGMMSDRARTKWGRRAPYLLLLSVAGAFSLLGISQANTLLMILASWCFIQATVTGMQGTIEAALPDRVPEALRGAGAAALGLGTMFGVLVGQITASVLVKQGYFLPYAILAGILVLVAVLFVLMNPEPDNRSQPREKFVWRNAIAMLWVSPRKHPDFAWAFIGRFLFLLGFSMVQSFQLFILQDYIGLTRDGALAFTPVLAVCSLGAALLSTPLSGWLSDRIGRRKPFVLVSTILVGLAMVLPFFSASVPMMIAYAVVGGFGFGIFRAVDMSLISLVLPSSDDAAKDLGIAGIAAHLGSIIAPVAASVVILNFGGYQPLFVVGFALSIVGALCVLFIRTVR